MCDEKEKKELEQEIKEMRRRLEASEREQSYARREKRSLEEEMETLRASGDQPLGATSSAAADSSFTTGAASTAAGGVASTGLLCGGMGEIGDPSIHRLFRANSYTRPPPKITRNPQRQVSWLRRLRLHLAERGLDHTLQEVEASASVCVISSTYYVLLSQHSEGVVLEQSTQGHSV